MAGGPAAAASRPAPSSARVRLYYALTFAALLVLAEGLATVAAGILARKGVFYAAIEGDYAPVCKSTTRCSAGRRARIRCRDTRRAFRVGLATRPS
jgi:hypothetical protein